ncbi:MAG: isoprenylcysteine carboxylmethyltransferase family protein [Myxococcota bacterium]
MPESSPPARRFAFVEVLGAFFFRVRGVLPVPLVVTAVALSWRAHIVPGPGGAQVDDALNVVGLGLCVAGAVARLCTIALVPRGTSANNRALTAQGLNTTGPYAVVRHPLYLANAHLVVGLLCIAHTPWAWALGLGYFTVAYAFIIRAEEQLLERTFNEAWREWAARVPAWLPKLSALPDALKGPRDFRRAALREVNTLVAWGVGASLLLGWEWWARGQLYGVRGQALRGVLVTLLVLWPLGKLLRWRAR